MNETKRKLMSRGSVMDETNELLKELISEVKKVKELMENGKLNQNQINDISDLINKFKR